MGNQLKQCAMIALGLGVGMGFAVFITTKSVNPVSVAPISASSSIKGGAHRQTSGFLARMPTAQQLNGHYLSHPKPVAEAEVRKVGFLDDTPRVVLPAAFAPATQPVAQKAPSEAIRPATTTQANQAIAKTSQQLESDSVPLADFFKSFAKPNQSGAQLERIELAFKHELLAIPAVHQVIVSELPEVVAEITDRALLEQVALFVANEVTQLDIMNLVLHRLERLQAVVTLEHPETVETLRQQVSLLIE